jgi:hypothetical protein
MDFEGQRALQELHALAALEAFAWPPRIDTPYRMQYTMLYNSIQKMFALFDRERLAL